MTPKKKYRYCKLKCNIFWVFSCRYKMATRCLCTEIPPLKLCTAWKSCPPPPQLLALKFYVPPPSVPLPPMP